MSFNRDYLTIGLTLVLALILMGLPPGQKSAVAHTCRSSVLAAGQWLFSQVIRYAKSEAKTRFLLTQNVELALDNMRLRESVWENRRLRQAIRFKEKDVKAEVIPAEVIGRDPDAIFDTIVINGGRDEGFEVDWSVITTGGLVGHIAQVEARSSVVQLIMRSKVSAVVQKRRTQGIVQWEHAQVFRLRYVDANSLIRVGDRIISSGLGGRFPKGITIGVVSEVGEDRRDPLFKEVYLVSSVDFWNLEEVFVIKPDVN